MKMICRCGKVCRSIPCSECRGKNSKRNYDSRWDRLSRRVRAEEPLCHDCWKAGRTEPSTEVHHVIPLDQAPDLRYDRTNLVALCQACHRARHGGARPY